MGREIKDIAGQRFDRVVAVRYDGKRNGHTYWIFRCDCGEEISRARQNVAKNKYNACFKCRRGAGHHAWTGTGEMPSDYLTSIKCSAAAKGLEFDIDTDYLWNLYLEQDKKCAFTGWDIFFHKTYLGKKEKTVSLDRIDSTKGYIRGNLQWVHRDLNWMKRNLPDDKFIELCIAVANKQKETL